MGNALDLSADIMQVDDEALVRMPDLNGMAGDTKAPALAAIVTVAAASIFMFSLACTTKVGLLDGVVSTKPSAAENLYKIKARGIECDPRERVRDSRRLTETNVELGKKMKRHFMRYYRHRRDCRK